MVSLDEEIETIIRLIEKYVDHINQLMTKMIQLYITGNIHFTWLLHYIQTVKKTYTIRKSYFLKFYQDKFNIIFFHISWDKGWSFQIEAEIQAIVWRSWKMSWSRVPCIVPYIVHSLWQPWVCIPMGKTGPSDFLMTL